MAYRNEYENVQRVFRGPRNHFENGHVSQGQEHGGWNQDDMNQPYGSRAAENLSHGGKKRSGKQGKYLALKLYNLNM